MSKVSFGQTSNQSIESDTLLTPQERLIERVDTLVKYTRKQFYKNNFDRTIEIGKVTLELAKEIQDQKAIFRVYSLMGNAFLKVEDTLQAEKIFNEAILASEKLEDTTRNITTARIDLGNLYVIQKKFDKAIKQYKKAISLAEKLKDTTHLFILNYNLAELNLDAKQLGEASVYVAKTNSYVTNLKADAYQCVAKLVTGRLYLLKGQPDKAVIFLKESIELARKTSYIDALIEASEVYSDAEIELGNLESAIALLKQADEYKSEKYKADKIQAIETVTAKFKLDQYEQELLAKTLQNEVNREQTKRETTNFWIKIAVGILLLSSLVLLISYLKRKKLLKVLLVKNKQYLEAKEVSEEQVKAKNTLFSNITHELRTPMYGIIGVSNLLMEDDRLKHQSENLESLKFSADYLLSLINNVLQLTQIGSGNSAKLKQSSFNLKDLIVSVVSSAKYLDSNHSNSHTIDIDPAIPEMLRGDDIKLSQILMNLVSNSFKFTKNGFITISVEKKEERDHGMGLYFCIKDTGIGMSPEMQKQVFYEFSKTESDYKHQGTGLGLPIVKKLLQLHDSEIYLESELGKGTQISFEIWYEVVDGDTSKETPRKVSKNILEARNVLVVDDNKINQLVTKKTLEKQGASVTVAGSGPEAIELCRCSTYDLILMDINMPNMNGFETTEIIRTFNVSTPILALTAVEEDKIILENKPSLLNDFIIKPYDKETFLAILKAHLDN